MKDSYVYVMWDRLSFEGSQFCHLCLHRLCFTDYDNLDDQMKFHKRPIGHKMIINQFLSTSSGKRSLKLFKFFPVRKLEREFLHIDSLLEKMALL